MSLIPKLQTALSVVFILTTAGVIGVTAQTQPAADSSASNTVAIATSTSEPKKPEGKKSTTAAAENTAPDKTAEAVREASSSSEVASASTVTNAPAAKAATAPEAPLPQGAAADKWQFQFSPYLWLASAHGTVGIGARTVGVDESFGDVFHALNFAFMSFFEAHKGKLTSLTDIEYVDISDDKATPGPLFSNANAKFKTFIFDEEVGYRFFDDPAKGAFVDVVGGIRVWHVSTDLAFGAGILPSVEVQASRSWVDAVAGLRGKAALSKKAFVTGKFDLGGGGSKFTYQIFGGLGYNIKPKIALVGGYRVIDVNYNKNGFIYDMNQRGPIMGVGFRF